MVLLGAAALVLADSGIVTLALPELQHVLHTSVEGVAAVLGSYAACLAVALWPARVAVGRWGAARVGGVCFGVVAVGSVVCAVADTLPVLLAGRVLQAGAGAGGLLAAFALMGAHPPHGRLWRLASVVGAGVGPVLGGALTQALDWRWIFVVQVPVAVVASVYAWGASEDRRGNGGPPARRVGAREGVALALLSAALTSVLFLLVLELVAGRGATPLSGAAVVLALPAGAVAGLMIGARPPGPAGLRAACGCLLAGGGILALAWMPTTGLGWAVVPELLAGFGSGLALPVLGGERGVGDAAARLSIRHLGIAAALALLAPLMAGQLVDNTERAKERGVALLLNARLSPQRKLEIAPGLFAAVTSTGPRDALAAAFSAQRGRLAGDELGPYDELARRSDETLVGAVSGAFRWAYVICGVLALLAGLLCGVLRQPPSGVWVGVCVLAAALAPAAMALAARAVDPPTVAVSEPCHEPPLPSSGGLSGFVQDAAIQGLDTAACTLHVSRERLVLAVGGDSRAREGLPAGASFGLDLLGGLGIGG